MQCNRGHDNAPGAAFCGVCGQQLVAQEAQQTPLQPTPQAGYQSSGYQLGGYPTTGGGGPVVPPIGGYPNVGQNPQPRKKPIALWIGGGVGLLVVLALVLVVVVRNVAPSTTTMTVTLAVYDDDFRGCDLSWGYADVPGSNVIVRADGAIVATGSLSRIGTEELISCEFTARLSGVPTDGSFYTIEIGRRGTGDATRSELEANNWTYQATLGL